MYNSGRGSPWNSTPGGSLRGSFAGSSGGGNPYRGSSTRGSRGSDTSRGRGGSKRRYNPKPAPPRPPSPLKPWQIPFAAPTTDGVVPSDVREMLRLAESYYEVIQPAIPGIYDYGTDREEQRARINLTRKLYSKVDPIEAFTSLTMDEQLSVGKLLHRKDWRPVDGHNPDGATRARNELGRGLHVDYRGNVYTEAEYSGAFDFDLSDPNCESQLEVSWCRSQSSPLIGHDCSYSSAGERIGGDQCAFGQHLQSPGPVGCHRGRWLD